MRKLAIASLAALLSSSAVAAPQLIVARNHTARLPANVPVSTVIVGDPAVADVVVVNPQTVLVQGKANGRTEIIALDRAHRPVWQGEVAVVDISGARVTVLSPGRAADYNCASPDACAPAQAASANTAPAAAGQAASRAVSGARAAQPFMPR